MDPITAAAPAPLPARARRKLPENRTARTREKGSALSAAIPRPPRDAPRLRGPRRRHRPPPRGRPQVVGEPMALHPSGAPPPTRTATCGSGSPWRCDPRRCRGRREREGTHQRRDPQRCDAVRCRARPVVRRTLTTALVVTDPEWLEATVSHRRRDDAGGARRGGEPHRGRGEHRRGEPGRPARPRGPVAGPPRRDHRRAGGDP